MRTSHLHIASRACTVAPAPSHLHRRTCTVATAPSQLTSHERIVLCRIGLHLHGEDRQLCRPVARRQLLRRRHGGAVRRRTVGAPRALPLRMGATAEMTPIRGRRRTRGRQVRTDRLDDQLGGLTESSQGASKAQHCRDDDRRRPVDDAPASADRVERRSPSSRSVAAKGPDHPPVSSVRCTRSARYYWYMA